MNRNKSKRGERARLMEELNQAGRDLSGATVLFHSAMAERFGLSPTDSKTLDVLSRHGPVTAGELTQHTGLASASVTALVDRLEEKGMVRRVRDSKDRRKVFIELVPEGIAGLAAAFMEFDGYYRELWGSYTLEELKLILDFLRRSAEHTRAATAIAASRAQPKA